MTKTLEQLILEAYKLMHPDVYKAEPWIFPILTASIVSLHAGLWIFKPPRFLHPGSFFIATVGKPNTAKSTILTTTGKIARVGMVKRIEESTPEKLRENLSNLISERGFASGFILWDEAGELVKKLESYMDSLPYMLNQIYYSSDISFGTTSRGSNAIPAGSYILNMYFASLPDQWSQIESMSAGGFSRRVLPIHLKSKLPYTPRNRDEEEFDIDLILKWDELRHKLIPYLKYLQSRQWVLGAVHGMYHLSEKIEKDNEIDEEKKRMLVEYLYKIISTRALANIIPVVEKNITKEDYAWLDEQVVEMAEKIGVTLKVNEDVIKKLVGENAIYVYIDDNQHPPFLRTLKVETAEELFLSTSDENEDGDQDFNSDSKSYVSMCHTTPTPLRHSDQPRHYTQQHTHTPYIDTHKTPDTYLLSEASDSHVSYTQNLDISRHVTREKDLLNNSSKLVNELFKSSLSVSTIIKMERQLNVAMFSLPTSLATNFLILKRAMLQPNIFTAPDIDKAIKKIEEFIESHPNEKVLTLREFVKRVLKLGKASDYIPMMEILEDAEVIRKIPRGADPISGRQRFWIVVNTEAKICANCIYYSTTKCPLIGSSSNYVENLRKVSPTLKACNNFKSFKEGEQ